VSDNRNCGEAAIALLEAYGVDTVFGIPGVHTLTFYRGLGGSSIRHVLVRHEQGAGFMADGYARASGRPGVCLLITGPGVTNAATAIGQAFSDSVPMLVLSSVNATDDLGKGRGRLHEITSQQATMAPLTAFSRTIASPAMLPKAMADAFDVFASARPRPVHIEVPLDVLDMAAEGSLARGPAAKAPQPKAKDIAAAADLLRGARRPLILAGGGTIDCGNALSELVQRTGAVFIPSTAAKGVVPDTHPASLGSSLSLGPSQDVLARADVVLAIGTELAETDSWIDRLPIAGALIRIDIDAPSLTRDYTPAVAIHAEAGVALSALLDALGPTTPPAGCWNAAAEVAQARRQNLAAMEPLQRRHAKILDALRSVLPEDGIVCADMTQIAYTGCQHFPCTRPRSWFHPYGYGTLGYALPAAIGAKLAAPERPVVALVGDAGFLFTVQELATAAELKLPLPILLWNNDALGQIRDDMVKRAMPQIGVVGRNPDFMALALAFGCAAKRPASLDEFKLILKDALAADGPTVIELRAEAHYLD